MGQTLVGFCDGRFRLNGRRIRRVGTSHRGHTIVRYADGKAPVGRILRRDGREDSSIDGKEN